MTLGEMGPKQLRKHVSLNTWIYDKKKHIDRRHDQTKENVFQEKNT